MKKFLIALLALALVSPLMAQEPEAEPPPIVEASHNAVVAFLKLSSEQAAAWDDIYWIHRDDEAPLKKMIAGLTVTLGIFTLLKVLL